MIILNDQFVINTTQDEFPNDSVSIIPIVVFLIHLTVFHINGWLIWCFLFKKRFVSTKNDVKSLILLLEVVLPIIGETVFICNMASFGGSVILIC